MTHNGTWFDSMQKHQNMPGWGIWLIARLIVAQEELFRLQHQVPIFEGYIMSTHVIHYLVWGVKLPYIVGEDEAGNDIEEIYKLDHNWRKGERKCVCLIRDGMGGKYSVLGYIEDFATDEDGFSGPHRIFDTSPGFAAEVKIFEIAAALGLDIEKIDPYWMVFTHYA